MNTPKNQDLGRNPHRVEANTSQDRPPLKTETDMFFARLASVIEKESKAATPETLSERIIQAWLSGQDAADLRALADSAPNLREQRDELLNFVRASVNFYDMCAEDVEGTGGLGAYERNFLIVGRELLKKAEAQ